MPEHGSPSTQRAADALRALEAMERRRRAALRAGWTIALFVLVPLLVIAAVLLLVGHQHHVLTLEVGDAVIQIISRRGEYEIETPEAEPDFDEHRIPGWFVVETIKGGRITPRVYPSALFARTHQTVKLPENVTGLVFTINGKDFEIVGRELQCGERRWLISRGRVAVVEVDKIRP